MIVPLLLAVDFRNFTYTQNPCSANVPVPVVMRKGSFDYQDNKMGAGFTLYVYRVIQGSLQPGTHQAVVVIVCDFPAGGTIGAYLFDVRQNSAKLMAHVANTNWGLDWGGRPSSVHIRFTNKFLYVDRCKDDQCDQAIVTTYALKNGRLQKVYELTHKPPPGFAY